MLIPEAGVVIGGEALRTLVVGKTLLLEREGQPDAPWTITFCVNGDREVRTGRLPVRTTYEIEAANIRAQSDGGSTDSRITRDAMGDYWYASAAIDGWTRPARILEFRNADC